MPPMTPEERDYLIWRIRAEVRDTGRDYHYRTEALEAMTDKELQATWDYLVDDAKRKYRSQ